MSVVIIGGNERMVRRDRVVRREWAACLWLGSCRLRLFDLFTVVGKMVGFPRRLRGQAIPCSTSLFYFPVPIPCYILIFGGPLPPFFGGPSPPFLGDGTPIFGGGILIFGGGILIFGAHPFRSNKADKRILSAQDLPRLRIADKLTADEPTLFESLDSSRYRVGLFDLEHSGDLAY